MSTKAALVIIALCLAMLYPLQKYLDSLRPVEDSIEDVLYLPSGETVKRLSFGFDGLLADVYWLRSVQYFGQQLLNKDKEIDFTRLSDVRYDLLYPLLNITTTLDPHYIAAYRFGATFLPDYNHDLALKLVQKGIENNPDNWRLYQNLATLYWKAKDYRSASETFFKGAEKPKAPFWMKIMGGVMLSEGGSRATACKLYSAIYEEALESNDDLVRTQMEVQIKRVQALDELDYLNEMITRYREENNRCPNSLLELLPLLRRNSGRKGSCGQPLSLKLNNRGQALSPIGKLYLYDPAQCKATLPFEIGEP
jgi:tetratricopeptide (TPR) repeat protein